MNKYITEDELKGMITILEEVPAKYVNNLINFLQSVANSSERIIPAETFHDVNEYYKEEQQCL